MLVVVKNRFRDRFTGNVREIGDTFEVGRKRFNELVKAGDFVEELIETTHEVVEELEEKNGEDED